jgi:hypothetical protein
MAIWPDQRIRLAIGGLKGGIGRLAVFFIYSAMAGMMNDQNDNWSIGSSKFDKMAK